MKILFISPRFDENSGGDGLYAYVLAKALAIQKNDVFTLSIRDGLFVLYKSTISEMGEVAFTVIREFYQVGTNECTKNIYSKSASKSVEETISMVVPDIIHIHGIHQYFTVSSARRLKKTSIPIIVTLHDYKVLCGNAGFFSDRTGAPCTKCVKGNILYPITERCKKSSLAKSVATSFQMALWSSMGFLGRVNSFHAPSQFVYDIVQQNIHMKGKTHFIRYPVLNDRLTKNTNIEDPLRIMFSGRMVPHKGGKIFANAVKNLDIRIDVFGDGPEYSDVKQILDHKKNVQFHGWVSRETIRGNMNANTIVVLPYLTHETFCFAVLEAMLEGACVITTTRGAIPELITHDRNGMLIDNPTPENFEAILKELILKKHKVSVLGSEASLVYKNLDTLSTHTEKMMNHYESFIL